MGNGQGVPINSLGHSNFQSPTNSNVKLALKDLLHVPTISKNLLSVSKFAQDNNVVFEFHPYHCFVKSQGSNQVLLEGIVGADGLYQFQPFKFLPSGAVCSNLSQASSVNNHALQSNTASVVLHDIPSSLDTFSSFIDCNKNASNLHQSCTSPVSSFHNSTHCNNSTSANINENNFHLWHFRLGHANSTAIKTILNLCKVPCSNKNASLSCTFCCIGKSHRLHAPLSSTVYTKPFEVIHCDLWGPAPFVSYYGYSYYITFVDTFTKYTWIYFLKSKADALKAFKQFLALVQNQFNASIKALQSDWGGEFRPFTALLNDLGIVHRLTCPHTSHQNGTVERKHRQIVEMGLTLLSHASLPLKFWDHSFTQSVYLINKLPSSALSNFQSPHHALYKSHPDYTHLKTFGCLCFPHLRPYNKHKLQFRSSPCVYLGISPQHKGHKCLDANGRIFVSKDVIFHESKFPYSSMFNSPTVSQNILDYPTNVIFSPIDGDSFSATAPQVSSPHSSATPQYTTPTGPDLHTSPSPLSVEQVNTLISQPLPVSSSPVGTPTTVPPIYPVVSNHNDHSMITRGKTGKLKPKVFLA
jgi:histone deacetylase 1/2